MLTLSVLKGRNQGFGGQLLYGVSTAQFLVGLNQNVDTQKCQVFRQST